MPCFGGCCAGKVARRGLLLVNFLNFIFGLAFIGTGAVSIQHVGAMKSGLDGYCLDWCNKVQCTTSVGCIDVKGCDCGNGQSSISFETFVAPGGGFVAVGVFSCLTAFLGCAGATRTTPSCLLAYMAIVCFIILLQFSFGIAAAVAETPYQVIDDIKAILIRDPTHIDWSFVSFAMPAACTAVKASHTDDEGVKTDIFRPACSFENICAPASLTDPAVEDWEADLTCCDPTCSQTALDENACRCNRWGPNGNPDKCIYGKYCMYSAFFNILTPVSGLALATIFFEVLAVCWALATWQSAKRGDYDQGGSNPAKEIPMDNM